MEKKNNTGLYVVIGILIFLFLMLIILVGILIFKGFGEREEKTGNDIGIEATQLPENARSDEENDLEGAIADKSDDEFGEEIKTDDVLSGGKMTYVVGGFQFMIPEEYSCFYHEEIGTVVYLDDVFQMKTAVVEPSYEEVMKNPESLMEKAVDAGWTITQDIKEIEMDGVKYLYYRADASGDESFVVYTQSPDVKKRIGAQIALEKKNLSDEDVLHVFASIASSAVATDKPDSTMEDIEEQIIQKSRIDSYGEVKLESTLEFDKEAVTYKVPDGFYSEDIYEGLDYAAERFRTGDPYIEVVCRLYSDGVFEGAQQYIELSANEVYELETMEIDGITCYVLVEKYQYDDSYFQRIYAGCDLERGFYMVEALAIDEDVDLQLGMIQEFLQLTRF